MQQRCKCPEKLFGVCRNAANASKNFLEFAGTLQVLRKTIWSLQERCKGLEKLSGVCNIVVSISKSTLAATALYRKHPIGIRKSIPSSNIRYREVWKAKPSVYLRPTAILMQSPYFSAHFLVLGFIDKKSGHASDRHARFFTYSDPIHSIRGTVADDLLTVLPLCASCRR